MATADKKHQNYNLKKHQKDFKFLNLYKQV